MKLLFRLITSPFRWLAGCFKGKRHGVKITIHPLQGLGVDRKATLKFVNKYFKKCGNFDEVHKDILTTRTQGNMYIYAKVPAKIAKKLEKVEDSLGFDLDVKYYSEALGKKQRNRVRYYEERQEDWVVTA